MSGGERKEAQRRRSLEWYYKNREKCKAQKKAWFRSRTESQKEKDRARNRAWYAAHREDILARRREHNAANREDILRRKRERYSPEKAREYRNRADVKAKRKAYRARPEIRARVKVQRHALYERHKEKVKEQVRRYRADHPEFREYLRWKSSLYNAYIDQRCREDPKFYADVRAYDRRRRARKCMEESRVYKPVMSRWIPDGFVKGDCRLDNLGPEAGNMAQYYDVVNRGSK